MLDNACADFLSRPVYLSLIGDDQPFEANLKAIKHNLNNLSLIEGSISITPKLKRKEKDFFVHHKRFFCRTMYGIRFVPHIGMRESILKGLHDEVGH